MRGCASATDDKALWAALMGQLDVIGLRRPLRRLVECLGRETPAYLVGGAPRDCRRSLLEARAITPKDADVVIDTCHLASALSEMPGAVTRTPLGGFRWVPVDVPSWIDVWQLHDTAWIKALGLPSTVDAFLAGVDLNIDRIAVGVEEEIVVDRGCMTGLQRRVIDLDAEIRLKSLEAAELARAVLAHVKTGYLLTENVERSLRDTDLALLTRSVFGRLRQDGHADTDLQRVWGFIVNR